MAHPSSPALIFISRFYFSPLYSYSTARCSPIFFPSPCAISELRARLAPPPSPPPGSRPGSLDRPPPSLHRPRRSIWLPRTLSSRGSCDRGAIASDIEGPSPCRKKSKLWKLVRSSVDRQGPKETIWDHRLRNKLKRLPRPWVCTKRQ